MPQSLCNILGHFVFSVKHRDLRITAEIQEQLYPYVGGILRNLGCHVIKIGGVEDHIHILCALSRTVSIADTMKKVKGNSSKWVNEQWPSKDPFRWQEGYGALPVGQGDVEGLVRYIDGQEAHHKKVSFQDEFRELMRIAGIEIDERYVWD